MSKTVIDSYPEYEINGWKRATMIQYGHLFGKYAAIHSVCYWSLRVLEKCGFRIIGEDKGFANARGREVEEFLLELH